MSSAGIAFMAGRAGTHGAGLTDRQSTKQWLREVLGEARAALSDEIMRRSPSCSTP